MKVELNEAIRSALAGSSSQKPVYIDTLFKRGIDQAALLEMYRQQEVCCCMITKFGVSKSVWWLPIGDIAKHTYGRNLK